MDRDIHDTRASRRRLCEWYDCDGVLDWYYRGKSGVGVCNAEDWRKDCYYCMSFRPPFRPSPKAND